MLQHVLLTMAAPPLLWLGAPLFPLLRGLPQPIRAVWVATLLRSKTLRRCFAWLTQPVVALLLYVAATWLWHLPAAYEMALRSAGVHYLQHLCFLGTALLFWYPVVRPYPFRPRWSTWLLLPYLLVTDVQNTLLSAWLTFSAEPLYPYYLSVPRLEGISAAADQATAGVLMWVIGSLAFLAPLCWIGVRLLYGERPTVRTPVPVRVAVRTGQGEVCKSFDLLRVPGLGRFLKWRHARLALQILLAILAVIVIADGLFGPQVGALNLAGVLPWIHWRGFVVLGLLTLGNVFCMACPFMLPRMLARKLLPANWIWPRRLQNKWLAVVLLGLFFWAYEAFALWDSPWWTAWIAIGYFALAFVVDGFFRGASFCKYVCPIGQFNFVQSLLSPLEVKVRSPAVCASCQTKECIRGGEGIPGCELKLYQPRKLGNMDCTFCLDCVHSCPHENVGILATTPGRELWRDPLRSGIGRFSRRPDLAALVAMLVFAAFANAAGMVGPVVDWEDQLKSLLGLRSLLPVVTAFYVAALLVMPLLLIGGAAALSRRWSHESASWRETATRFTFALVPLGFSMWLAHYCFHLLTSYDAVVPATQRLVADLGWTTSGAPLWGGSCCRTAPDWLPRVEIVCLDFGLLLSLYAGYHISTTRSSRPGQALKAFIPWSLVIALLFLVGIWIVLQPMQMRGTIQMAG